MPLVFYTCRAESTSLYQTSDIAWGRALAVPSLPHKVTPAL